MSDTPKKPGYDFLANILKLSKTKLESELPEEWIFICEEKCVHKNGQCICNAKIKNIYHYINPKMGHAIMTGSSCRNKLKLHLKKDKQSGAKKIINMFFGKGVTYEIIQNLENYSLFCWNEILKLCDQKIKNLKQEEWVEYKKNISDFLENFTKADFKDTKNQIIVIEKFKSYLRQIDEEILKKAQLEQKKEEERLEIKRQIEEEILKKAQLEQKKEEERLEIKRRKEEELMKKRFLNTQQRKDTIEKEGYKVISIWQCDWTRRKKLLKSI